MQASAKRLLPQQPLFFEAEDGIRDGHVTGVQTCALPISGTGLLASMAEHDLPIRGSLVWGRVLSRSGDVFGPIVNLASRLGDVATEGMLLMDDVSAALLQESDREDDFLAELGEAMEVPGLRTVTPALLRRRI